MRTGHVKGLGRIAFLATGLVLLGYADLGWAAEPSSAPAVEAQMDDRLLAAKAHGNISAQDALALEQTLAIHPEDHVARVKLLGYYFPRVTNSKDAAEARQKHIFWLIEHEPNANILSSPYAILNRETDGDALAKGKALWLAQVGKHPKSTAILENAAEYLYRQDSGEAEKLWLHAKSLEPNNPKWSESLGRLYQRMATDLPAGAEQRQVIASRGLDAYETALRLTQDAEHRFYLLPETAKIAVDAGDANKATAYANELLEMAKAYREDWNYGNAIHYGHLVLGQVALRAADIASAKAHLIEAGKTPGSPQLDSFGPSMSLAKELLAKGERDAVIEYFQLCGKFWRMDRGKLTQWKAEVEKGKTPDFGANLVY